MRAYHESRPSWLVGNIGYHDARFLFTRAVEARPSVAVEIGTGSGFSTGVLCSALAYAHELGLVGSDFEVVTYDVSERFYHDPSRAVGDAAREQLPEALSRHITFYSPATALHLGERFGDDEIEFLFIDANHGHPWPTLDLLAALSHLRPRAEVVLHDINLPSLGYAGAGAKVLFDCLPVEKEVSTGDEVPNTGSLRLPEDKEGLREELWRIALTHPWEAHVADSVKAVLLPQSAEGEE